MNDISLLNIINKLFLDKKYNEVILKIEENINFLENYPDLFNTKGVSKLLKSNHKKSDLISALSDFENYYLKSKANNKKIEAVCNFIATCVINCEKYPEFIPEFERVLAMSFVKTEPLSTRSNTSSSFRFGSVCSEFLQFRLQY